MSATRSLMVDTAADLVNAVGCTSPDTSWVLVDQDLIDSFAHDTGDLNWIHTDPARAKRSTYGATIAHGFLTLALIGRFSQDLVAVRELPTTINYGLDRVRFPSACVSGTRVRASAHLKAVVEIPDGLEVHARFVIEPEAGAKPVCVADQISWRLP